MKKLRLVGRGRYRCLLGLLVIQLALAPSIGFPESGSSGKGPDAEKVPDLDDVISPEGATVPPAQEAAPKSGGAAAGKNGDADSIADLEKAMENDTPGKSAPPPAAAKASEGKAATGKGDPEDLGSAKAGGSDDALLEPPPVAEGAKGAGGAPAAEAAPAPANAAPGAGREAAGAGREAAGAEDLEQMSKDAEKGPASGGGDDLELPVPPDVELTKAPETPPDTGKAAEAPRETPPQPPAEAATPALPAEDTVPNLEPAPAPPPPAAPSPRRARQQEAPIADARNRITNLEFKMEGQNSRVVVSSDTPLRFREVRNPQLKQVIYFFENTEVPAKLQRAYDTTEFSSPVALFTLLQMPRQTPPLSKLIIQLREDKTPSVSPNDRGLFVDFPPPSNKPEQRLLIGDQDSRLASEENIYSGGQTYTGKSIQRLEVKNSDVQDVLRLIAKSSGYNIVIGDDVQGKVGTLSLENLPWDQVFTLVLQSKKLGYIRQGNVLRVGTLGALKSEKEEALANEQSRIKVETLRTVLIPISYAKAGELAPQGKNFLTDRGTIDVDVRTNTIIVKDIEKVVARIQKLFAALDTQPPRVSISAKFVEMGEKFTRDLGLQNPTGNVFQTNFGGINLSGVTSFTNGGGLLATTINATQFANLTTVLSIGESEEKVKTVANPSVSVVANQAANVNQSFSFFIPVQQIAGGIATNTLQQVTTNLTLQVTPLVAGDGSIFMTVNIHNDIPSGKGAQTTVDGRNVTTQILLENGDTAVVGGIFSNTTHSTREGIPLLMHVPVLGYLFSNNHRDDTRNELFVFLTAKIMNAEESFKRTF